MKPLEALNLAWYLWRRSNWMLARHPRFDAKLGGGQDHRPTFLTCRFDLP